jgi:hypothetical protein
MQFLGDVNLEVLLGGMLVDLLLQLPPVTGGLRGVDDLGDLAGVRFETSRTTWAVAIGICSRCSSAMSCERSS